MFPDVVHCYHNFVLSSHRQLNFETEFSFLMSNRILDTEFNSRCDVNNLLIIIVIILRISGMEKLVRNFMKTTDKGSRVHRPKHDNNKNHVETYPCNVNSVNKLKNVQNPLLPLHVTLGTCLLL